MQIHGNSALSQVGATVMSKEMIIRNIGSVGIVDTKFAYFRLHHVVASNNHYPLEGWLLRIARSNSGIGFQPVALKMTGWKPIPLQKPDIFLIERSLSAANTTVTIHTISHRLESVTAV